MIENVLEKIKQYKLALVIALIGLVIAGFMILQREQKQENNIQQLMEQTSYSSSSTTEKSKQRSESDQGDKNEGMVTVDVKGAVKKPGVYQLKSSSRVHDALVKAGGMTDEADLKSINQAQKLVDEAVVYVAKVGENVVDVTTNTSTSNATSQAKAGLVNLNTATEADFQTISGIGQKRAQDIIAYREANGKFKSVDDLKNVTGIGAKTLEKLKEYVTVD
ncbi:comEA protein [Streptococcus sp. oral taxon 056 str. F0418]|uniref:helix-hairpin-helix domain-containing protein n=1 Tax=Streptococcus sp. oral taxon 056 TaxID=712620 RepID=UPI0002180B26|nr:helix-hairpin-helix domain-containing protein [Streptococcus sp. oral taxon 056]EGP66097.1 comEA protein [Streptococcus sp. oral taxon 056 str. F0418]